jgi:hypothetical protein
MRASPVAQKNRRRSGRARRETLLAPPPSMAAGVRSIGVVSRSSCPRYSWGFPQALRCFLESPGTRSPPAAPRILPNQARIASPLTIFPVGTAERLGFSIVDSGHSDSNSNSPREENARVGAVPASGPLLQVDKGKLRPMCALEIPSPGSDKRPPAPLNPPRRRPLPRRRRCSDLDARHQSYSSCGCVHLVTAARP